MAEIRPTNAFNLKIGLADGDSAETDMTVTCPDGTSITAKDKILFVGHISTKASIATFADITSEASVVTEGSIQLSTTDTSNDQLIVFFNHVND